MSDLAAQARGIARLTEIESFGPDDPRMMGWLEDGYALWQLHDAVAAKWGREEGRGVEWHMGIDRWERDGRVSYDMHVNHMASGSGDTIAEAADACREAIDSQDDSQKP